MSMLNFLCEAFFPLADLFADQMTFSYLKLNVIKCFIIGSNDSDHIRQFT